MSQSLTKRDTAVIKRAQQKRRSVLSLREDREWLSDYASDPRLLLSRMAKRGALVRLGELRKPETRADLLELIEVKLNRNRSVSSRNREAVERLNGPRRIGLLRSPERHIEPDKGFDTLSFLFDESPSVAEMTKTVDKTIIRPILAPAR